MNHDLWPHITIQTISSAQESADTLLAIVAESQSGDLSDNFCCAQLMGFMTDTPYITGLSDETSCRESSKRPSLALYECCSYCTSRLVHDRRVEETLFLIKNQS